MNIQPVNEWQGLISRTTLRTATGCVLLLGHGSRVSGGGSRVSGGVSQWYPDVSKPTVRALWMRESNDPLGWPNRSPSFSSKYAATTIVRPRGDSLSSRLQNSSNSGDPLNRMTPLSSLSDRNRFAPNVRMFAAGAGRVNPFTAVNQPCCRRSSRGVITSAARSDNPAFC